MALTANDGRRLLQRYETQPGDDLFFLGIVDRRITFYSQQVRALELAHALSLTGRLRADDRFAVIGAGAAGLTAAIAVASLGARVALFDSQPDLLSRQRGSSRLLDPRIYDWPDAGALAGGADLPILTWTRGQAGATRDALVGHYNMLQLPNLTWQPNSRVEAVERVDDAWSLDHGGGDAGERFSKVIVAVGFGDEPGLGAAPPHGYWSRAGAPEPPHAGARCAVSGIGDGGLTDMLALLVQNFEHQAFTERFLALAPARAFQDAVEAAYAADLAGGLDLEPAFDAHVRPALEQYGVLPALTAQLRPQVQVVMVCERGRLLERGAAARLNQLMAYAVARAAVLREPDSLRMARGRLQDVADAAAGRKRLVGPDLFGGVDPGEFDLVIVRHGPPGEHLNWLGPLVPAYRDHRRALATDDPESAAPPRLHPETYDFFDQRLDPLFPPPTPSARAAARAARQRQILVQPDRATRRLVRRGAASLEDVLLGGAAGYELHVEGALADYGALAPLLARSVRASAGRMTLMSDAQHLADWQSLRIQAAPRGAALEAPLPPVPAPSPEELTDLLDLVLLRQLNARLIQIWNGAHCGVVGAIHPATAQASREAWEAWLGPLEADATLRRHVLQLLWRSDADGSTWDEDTACVPRLAAALVLMLASGLALQDLAPGRSARRANLRFPGGEALGSGCQELGGRLIDDCRDPEAWDADLLILSGASELTLLDGGTLLIDAGADSIASLARPLRPRPALIKNSVSWRALLAGPPEAWAEAVAAEWQAFVARQNRMLEELP